MVSAGRNKILNSRWNLTGRIQFDQWHEGNEGGNHIEIQGKNIPGRGHSSSKALRWDLLAIQLWRRRDCWWIRGERIGRRWARKGLEIVFRFLAFLLCKGKVLGVFWVEEWFDLCFQKFLKLHLFESRLQGARAEAEISIVMMMATEVVTFQMYFESKHAHFGSIRYERVSSIMPRSLAEMTRRMEFWWRPCVKPVWRGISLIWGYVVLEMSIRHPSVNVQ